MSQINQDQHNNKPEELPLDSDSPKSKKNIGREIWTFVSDVLLNAVIILLIVGVTRTVFASPFQISGRSMEPNLHDLAYIVVDKITYRFREPERGDIIVLVPPENPETFFVKRIVGLPGEKIEFLNGNVIIHNEEYPTGIKLEEIYLSENNQKTYLPHKENSIIEIKERNYFVMGDNRSASNDSRTWGSLNIHNVEGRALLVAWPFENFEIIDKPEYIIEIE